MIKYGKGKVREYYNGYCSEYLLFEGEYLNGERNGKGKEYDYYGELIFEGEYKEGKRWNGKGKEYHWDDDYNEFEFIGEYLNGKKFGKEEKVENLA